MASNANIAQVFDEIADLLEIQGENAFRIRAYRNAARLVEGLGESLADMLNRGEDLTELPGIGKDLAAKIHEIIGTGTCAAREDLRKKLPPTITTLLKVPGLGPKRVQTLYRTLDISTPAQLHAAAHEGKIRELPGFGEKTEMAIRQALAQTAGTEKRFTLAAAARAGEPLRAALAKVPGVRDVVIAGSYRRAKETVGDLDLVVTAKHGEAVMDSFCGYPEVAQIVSQGDTRSTVVLKNGLQVDLRVVPQESFGAALYYFTGSKTHNVATRRMAQQRDLKINEYGVYRGRRRIAGETEQSVFEAIDLPYIPPELRENRGEIEAAAAGKLPRLVTPNDLEGDLHVHASDTHALQALIAAARRRGLRFLGVSTAQPLTGASEAKRWLEQLERAQKKLTDFHLLKTVSVDIDEDGNLSLADALLREFDIVFAGVNHAFALPRTRQTARVRRALEQRSVTVLAHPTGRLIGTRPACDLDMPAVIRAAHDAGCLLELNSQPERLDLPDVYCRLAKEEGVTIAITSDARSTAEIDYLDLGVGQARRGWLEAKDVANTLPLAELEKLLKHRR